MPSPGNVKHDSVARTKLVVGSNSQAPTKLIGGSNSYHKETLKKNDMNISTFFVENISPSLN